MLRTIVLIPVLMFALMSSLFAASTAAVAPETEDVIYMNDGRVLHGTILSENDEQIVFELVDRKYNLKTPLTLNREDVADIQRDLALPSSETTPDAAPATGTTPAALPSTPTAAPTGKAADEPVDMSLPGIYVVPMKGQMGTDVCPEAYAQVIEEVKAQKPALIVIEMECRDFDDLMINMVDEREAGLKIYSDFNEIVDLFRDELRDVPQVMWVKDSVGISSLVALAWSDLYMTRTARLGGLSDVITNARAWQDTDIRAKMTAATLGHARGFLENGKYPVELGDAMMVPEHTISASFKGRGVVWHLDSEGDYEVDTDKEKTISFRANTAENLTISDGTVDELDDLLFLCGFREYRLIDGPGRQSVEKYVEDWRRTFEDTKVWWDDYQQFLGWAGGSDALKYYGQAKSRLNQIINAMRRYKALERRWGTSVEYFIVLEEKLTEQIRGLKQGGGGGGGGGRGGGGRNDPGR